jgi:hypothetical protein
MLNLTPSIPPATALDLSHFQLASAVVAIIADPKAAAQLLAGLREAVADAKSVIAQAKDDTAKLAAERETAAAIINAERAAHDSRLAAEREAHEAHLAHSRSAIADQTAEAERLRTAAKIDSEAVASLKADLKRKADKARAVFAE